MQRSVALVIINDYERNIISVLKNSFYKMDMMVAILIRKTSKEIQAAINQLTEMDGSTILDIICVIHSVQPTFRTFKTQDGALDLYKDIVNPLLRKTLEDKVKCIILSGTGYGIDLKEVDSVSSKPYTSGKNVAMVSSKSEDFICTFIPKLVSLGGNFKKAVDECSNLVDSNVCTKENVVLCRPSYPYTTITTDHEFN